jgi:signal peptidase II
MPLGLAVALVAAIIDQLGKWWILRLFAADPGEHVRPEGPVLNFALVMNHGVSFGLFNGSQSLNAAIFVVIAALIVAALLVWLWRAKGALLEVAIGLVVGGAIGNVIDRLVRGAVVDFLDFHLGEWHWFIFNLADAAISIGVGLMIIDGLRGRRETRN